MSVILPDATTVSGVRCQLHHSRIAGDAGYQADYRGSVLIVAPTTAPAVRSLVQVDGTYYRVIGLEHDSFTAGLRIDLGEVTRQ